MVGASAAGVAAAGDTGTGFTGRMCAAGVQALGSHVTCVLLVLEVATQVLGAQICAQVLAVVLATQVQALEPHVAQLLLQCLVLLLT